MPIPVPVGRGQLIDRLAPLPACSLIRAPSSTGKRTVVQYLADREGIPRIDQRMVPATYWADDRGRPTEPGAGHMENLRFMEPELTVDMVRDVVSWTRSAPRTAAGKLAIIRLDHDRMDGSRWVASSRAVTTLLKTLEEPPPGVRFALLASGPVAQTVVSRLVVVTAGLLSAAEVEEILYKVSDLSRHAARDAAALGSGQVAPALSLSSSSMGVRELVLGLLSDLSSGDIEAAAARAREWSRATTVLLVRAAHERVTGRYVAFTAEELSVLSLPMAMKLLTVVRRCAGARPRLLVGALLAALS